MLSRELEPEVGMLFNDYLIRKVLKGGTTATDKTQSECQDAIKKTTLCCCFCVPSPAVTRVKTSYSL